VNTQASKRLFASMPWAWDLMLRMGIYPGTPKPTFVPGLEVAGSSRARVSRLAW
jgi:hypothetical protein